MAGARGRGPAMAPYLPRLVIQWAEEAPEERWRRIDGSLLFVDISGFTALSERLARHGRIGGEELTEVLSACFTDLLGVAYAQGGGLLKFGGDALLMLFDGDGHAQRACRAAIGMQAAMRTAGRRSTSVGSIRLRMSAGINSGDLHVFRVGASHRELLVTGPGATTTVEMEAAAGAGQIVISPATAVAVDHALVGRHLGPGRLLRRVAMDVAQPGFPEPPRPSGDLAHAIPVALRDHLAAGAVESEHRHATVAFVHFDGVDDLLRASGAAAVADALHDLVGDVQAAVDEQGVTFLASDIDRDGGKIILLAGAPRVLGDDEGRMLRALRRIADSRHPLAVRIGVHRGHMFVGAVGPPYRLTYTVIGDAVNLAARLMARAEAGQILASSDVLERARTGFEATALAPFTVKGKAKPVEAFAVGAANGSRASPGTTQLPFGGRHRELGVLLDALASAADGHGRSVEITGEPGIGKSRLLSEARSRAGAVPAWTTACEPYETATPYYAFRQLLRQALGLGEAATPGTAAAQAVREAVGERAPELLPWLPLLTDVVGVDVAPTEETSALEPQFRRQRTNHVVSQLLGALLTGSHLLAFEDVQWMDEASAEMLGTLAATVDDRPWLIVVTRREDGGGFRAPDDGAVARLPLHPLEAGAAEALVTAATTDAPLRPHEHEALVQRAGGNPLFLEELLRGRAGRVTGDALPESLEAVVAMQIDRLRPADRRLLRCAAVLGVSFDPGLLAAVGEEVAPSASGARARLRGFVEPDGRGRLRFRNRLVRDVAYETLPFRRRRELHGLAGEAIERAAGEAAGDHAEVLSLHFLHSQRYGRCWHYARLAGDRAKQKYANVEAAELYQRALTAARHLPELPPDELATTWEALGDVSNLAGEYDTARDAYRQTRLLRADHPVAVADLRMKEARVADRQGKALAAVRSIHHGLRLLDGSGDVEKIRQRAELRVMYAWSRQSRGHHREAVRWCEIAVEEGTASDNLRAVAQAYTVLDWAHLDLGRPDLAVHAEKALEIWEELGDLANQAILLNNMGAFAYYQGRWDRAVELYTQSRDANERVGNVVDAAFGTCNIAEILVDQGRLAEAEESLHEVVRLFRSVGYRSGVAFAQRHLGRIAVRHGLHADAQRLLTEARAVFDAHGLAAKVLEVDAWMAECLLRQGDHHHAMRLLDDAIRRANSSGGTALLATLHRLRGYGNAAAGRLVDAWADLDASLHVARARDAAFDVALTLEALSVVAGWDGSAPDPAVEIEREQILDRLGVQSTPPPPVTSGCAR